MNTDYELIERESTARRRGLRREELILEVTEAIAAALEESGVSRSELARRLGKSKAFVSQVMAGGRNLTLGTISDIADALDSRPKFQLDEPAKASLRRVRKDRLVVRQTGSKASKA
jgi:transcriptional regulator with XRE-family HTH domain